MRKTVEQLAVMLPGRIGRTGEKLGQIIEATPGVAVNWDKARRGAPADGDGDGLAVFGSSDQITCVLPEFPQPHVHGSNVALVHHTDPCARLYFRLVALAYPDPDLEDGSVRLRRWAHGDLDCVRQAAGDPRIPEGTTVPAVFTADAGREFIERQWGRAESGEGVSLAVAGARTDEALGLAVLLLRTQAGVAGIGYWVVPRARGRGVATRAVRLLSRWALRDAGLARVEAWVEPDNVASQRVLTAVGFAREGVLRSFLSYPDRRADAVVFSRTSEDADA